MRLRLLFHEWIRFRVPDSLDEPEVRINGVPVALQAGVLLDVLKILYGCRKSPRNKVEPNILHRDEKTICMATHMDDLIFFGELTQVKMIFKTLQREMLLHEGDELTYLGKIIRKTESGYELRLNDRLAQSYIKVCGVEKGKGVDTAVVRYTLQQEEQAVPLPIEEYTAFRMKLGKLLALSHDRADVQYAAMMLARHAATPTSLDIWRLKRVARYLVKFPKMPLIFAEAERPSHIVVWVDADWAGEQQTRRSTSGGVLQLGSSCLRSWARVQPCVSLSPAESEYYTLCTGAQEGILAQQLAGELGENFDLILRTDSAAAKQASEKIGALRQKHMQLRWHFLKDLVHSGLIKIEQVQTTRNISDMLTKAEPKQVLRRCLLEAKSWKVPEIDDMMEVNLVLQEETSSSAFQVTAYEEREVMTTTPWMLIITFIIGFVGGIWLMRLTCAPRRRTTATRTIGTQSQVTHTSFANPAAPRFVVLPERSQGAFDRGGLPLR